jgi:hypothetical protein
MNFLNQFCQKSIQKQHFINTSHAKKKNARKVFEAIFLYLHSDTRYK